MTNVDSISYLASLVALAAIGILVAIQSWGRGYRLGYRDACGDCESLVKRMREDRPS